MCLSVCTAISDLVERTAQNDSQEVDENDLSQQLAEVAAMLRDMRFQSTHHQRNLAQNELTEAKKCEWEHSLSFKIAARHFKKLFKICIIQRKVSGICWIIIFILNDLIFSLVLERVKEEMADRNAENQDTLTSIKEKLDQFNNELMQLRDSLNDAVKNIAKASENNSINQKKLEEYKVH